MIRAVNYTYPVHQLLLSNGCKVAYIDEGKGNKILLFVHGLATYSLSWRKNIESLKKYYRCIALDLPGNGLSDRGNYPYGINFFSGAVYDFMQLLGLRDVCLVGHSMGGQICLNLLINQPDAANKLILCAPAGFEQFSPLEVAISSQSMRLFDFISSEENNLRQTIHKGFFQQQGQADDMINELIDLMRLHSIQDYKKMIEKCVQSMLQEPVYSKLHLIKLPTLVLFGERDALIPNKLFHLTTTRKVAEDAVQKMADAHLKMIAQCGHFIQWEKAVEVNETILDFLK